ncbi:active breakpoint cluster region-related protein-like [Amphibalanus amphitrite]|uniref:active breakpoint cluster region-related protein-like n=1 Tax=Amphibalanus amphitrite TaxID=1232801 RepID=UPI001C905606|nr:active breakpoint cluster region-related protein-like [Amphibalanus amphitrite]
MGDSSELSSVPGPAAELPEAWEEDLEANIAKHRERAEQLKAQLNKENAYVQSLERLLADAKKRKASRDETADFADSSVTAESQMILDSESASDSDSRDSEPVSPTESTDGKPPAEANKPGFVTVISVTAAVTEQRGDVAPSAPAAAESPQPEPDTAEDRELTTNDKPESKSPEAQTPEAAAPEVTASDPSPPEADAGDDSSLIRKKVPPKPPPKTFRPRPRSFQPEPPSVPRVAKSQSFGSGPARPELIVEKPERKTHTAPGVPKYWRTASLAEALEAVEGPETPSPTTERPSLLQKLREDPETSAEPPAPAAADGVDSPPSASAGAAAREDDGTDIDAVPDDGYGSKDRPTRSSDRRQRVPRRIEPPVVPVQKSFSRDSIGVQKSHSRESLDRFVSTKDNLGKFSSRESLTNFPSRENLGKYASKESLKDSGTSSPRNASPKFFETKISRSASQSSSGSLPAASTPHRDYMEGIEEPLYDTVAPDPDGDADADADAEPDLSSASEYNGDTFKSASSGELELKSAANDTMRSEMSLRSQVSQTSVASAASLASVGSVESGRGEGKSARFQPAGRPPNYVNIDFFIKRKTREKTRESSGGDSDEDVVPLLRTISVDDTPERELDPRARTNSIDPDEVFTASSGVYRSPSDSPSAPPLPSPSRRESNVGQGQSESQRISTYRRVVKNVLDSETMYVECLNVTTQYMKVLNATIGTSRPVISQDDFNSIFFKIPELYKLHSDFLDGLRAATTNWDGYAPIGPRFKQLAENMGVYGAYLQNYQHALETVRRCSANSAEFAEITRCIKLRSLQGQTPSLEELLHKPVARVQQNAPVLHDLLKYLPPSHPDHRTMGLAHALTMTQSFISKYNVAASNQPRADRMQRHVVKNSFIVELVDNHRKLRHLFLFNDVIVCAKYKASGRGDKFTFEVKWLIPLAEIVCSCDDLPADPRADPAGNSSLVTLKSQASTVRDQIRAQERYYGLQGKRSDQKTEKQRKKLAELESQLVTASPNLPFRVYSRNGKQNALFFLSSDFDRTQWQEAIHVLQTNTPPSLQAQPVSFDEVQSWITTCRKDLQTNMGSYLMRTGRDESLLVGDLHIKVQQLSGLAEEADMFICFEIDSYGHFFRKAKTKPMRGIAPQWNEDFILELDGSHSLRILCYENCPRDGPVLRGRSRTELSRTWLTTSMQERTISLEGLSLTVSVKYASYEMTKRRPPAGKSNRLFGSKIQDVCRREDRSVPFIITSCLREVERRGTNETGVYRVSGSATDINRLKKLYETNIYEAEQLIKEVDIHSVTGLLKLYLRELPEALFTDGLYGMFFDAFSSPDLPLRRRRLLQLFSQLPQLNQSIIVYLIEHLIKVNKAEVFNKMSLHNLATVFGPTLLRPGPQADSAVQPDLLAAGTVDVMAQAGILYFFLQRRSNGEPIQVGVDGADS